jgi:hypothetical protein
MTEGARPPATATWSMQCIVGKSERPWRRLCCWRELARRRWRPAGVAAEGEVAAGAVAPVVRGGAAGGAGAAGVGSAGGANGAAGAGAGSGGTAGMGAGSGAGTGAGTGAGQGAGSSTTGTPGVNGTNTNGTNTNGTNSINSGAGANHGRSFATGQNAVGQDDTIGGRTGSPGSPMINSSTTGTPNIATNPPPGPK